MTTKPMLWGVAWGAWLVMGLVMGLAWPCGAADRPLSLSVAAASDLVFCLEGVNEAFTNKHPHVQVSVTPGASGNLFAQIRRGAPFDVFLSADMNYPVALAKAGSADGSTIFCYAIGHLVLWSRRADIDVGMGLKVLLDSRIRRIAIANPVHAPYGRAARAALESAGLWDPCEERLVMGENVAQTAQFVDTGNADLGLIAKSLVFSKRLKGVGGWWEVPEEYHPALEQGGILTQRGATNAMAGIYREFLLSPEARAVFAVYGFQPPPEE